MKKLTTEQAVVISAYTGILCCEFVDLHEYIEKIMERPVFTHELGDKKMSDKIKEKARPDFLKLCPMPEKMK